MAGWNVGALFNLLSQLCPYIPLYGSHRFADGGETQKKLVIKVIAVAERSFLGR